MRIGVSIRFLFQIIKQSHIILNFLAMESKITNDDIDIIWQAAQLKHCSKQVFDLLAPLIKNLEPGPVTHLYHLQYKMEPKDHTEQVSFWPLYDQFTVNDGVVNAHRRHFRAWC